MAFYVDKMKLGPLSNKMANVRGQSRVKNEQIWRVQESSNTRARKLS